MKSKLSPQVFKKLKTIDVRIRKSFREKYEIFKKEPLSPELNNHELTKEYTGFRSINITADYRAIYKEIAIGNDTIAYFVLLGTHEELYK